MNTFCQLLLALCLCLSASTTVVAAPRIIINEVNYNSIEDFNPEDWVELYNAENQTVDISGWHFRDEDDTHDYSIPAGTVMESHSYLVLCSDVALFTAQFPTVQNYRGGFGFGLSGGGELLRLYDAEMNIADSLTYDDDSPWPADADGKGATLELISPDYDNALGESWAASKSKGGTPGAQNGNTNSIAPNESLLFRLYQNYPNPFNTITEIHYTLLQAAQVNMTLYDMLGKPVKTIINGYMGAGPSITSCKGEELPPGQYLYAFRVNGKLIDVKLAVVYR